MGNKKTGGYRAVTKSYQGSGTSASAKPPKGGSGVKPAPTGDKQTPKGNKGK